MISGDSQRACANNTCNLTQTQKEGEMLIIQAARSAPMAIELFHSIQCCCPFPALPSVRLCAFRGRVNTPDGGYSHLPIQRHQVAVRQGHSAARARERVRCEQPKELLRGLYNAISLSFTILRRERGGFRKAYTVPRGQCFFVLQSFERGKPTLMKATYADVKEGHKRQQRSSLRCRFPPQVEQSVK